MSRRTQRNVGVIGLGIIGQRVAECLRRRGFPVFVWNRTPRPVPNFVGSPAEIAQLADYIQIFVSDDDALMEMVQQLKMTLKAHHVVMAHCTVAPSTMRAAAEIVQRRGAHFLDAPFTGSKLAAEKGELVYYIGGDDAAFRRARPVLEASSKELIEIGEVGQATTIKIATNMVTAATVQVAAEALAVVQHAGMPSEKFATAMRGNASNSATLTMKLPKMIEGDFDPHFSVKHMLKDVEIASRLARSHGLSLGATDAARSSLRDEMRQGRGDYDYTSLVRVLVPPPNEPEVVEVSESDHPLLGLEEAGPREEAANEAAERRSEEESMPLAAENKAAEESKEAAVENKSASEVKVEEVVESTEPRDEEESTLSAAKTEGEAESVEARNDEKSVSPEEGTESVIEPLKSHREPEVDYLPGSKARLETADNETEPAGPEQSESDPAAAEKSAIEEPEEATVLVEKAAEPIEEKRSFFSRIFSKSTREKDSDY